MHIKIYEDFFESKSYDKKYWTVNITQPYFEISLDKLGFEYEYEGDFIDIIRTQLKNKNKHIFITCFTSITKGIKKTYWDYEIFNIESREELISNNYKYKGDVPVSQEEIDKWNLEHEINKYNL